LYAIQQGRTALREGLEALRGLVIVVLFDLLDAVFLLPTLDQVGTDVPGRFL
jgi:hypothetical protein